MANPIHRNGDAYREWSSNCDRYNTAPMTRAEMASYLASARRERPRRIEQRLARADRYGTSSKSESGRPEKRDATSWDDERCERCEHFHHAYEPRDASGACRSCGEGARDASHRPPCQPKATMIDKVREFMALRRQLGPDDTAEETGHGTPAGVSTSASRR